MLFSRDGASHFASALAGGELETLIAVTAAAPTDKPGVRLAGYPALAKLLDAEGPIGRIAASFLGAELRPVRAVLFDKSAAANWALGWHQDRTIVVARRIETPGFGPWSVKAGLQHVEPPFAILERMVTLRIHLDQVGPANAPLLIAPGSHLMGKLPIADISLTVAQCGTQACLAGAGDIWAYSTPILHASEAALTPTRRRVLQVDFAAFDLPGGLEWLGV